MSWELPRSSIYHTEETKAQNEPISCSADPQASGGIHFDFDLARGKGTEYLRFDLAASDLADLLFSIAEQTPGASTLFAQCLAKAIAADEVRFSEIAGLAQEGPHILPWIAKATKRYQLKSSESE